MAYDLEEQEKIDALKDWWDKNGTRVVIIAFLIAASILGWRGYQWYEQHQATKAMGISRR
nr:tetratricopeptide repeat protein [Paenalcaligenes hominis]